MLGADKDAVICDLAETYGILDYTRLPVLLLATLCTGLHENSRIKRKFSNLNEIPAEYTLVHIADALTMLVSALSGAKKKPELYSDMMIGKRKETERKGGFESIADFEAARKRYVNG